MPTTPMTNYIGTATHAGQPIGTYSTAARTKADAIIRIQSMAADDAHLTRTEQALVKVEFQ